MKTFPSAAMVALLLPTLTLAVHWKSPNLKTFDSAQQECAEYLRLSNDTLDRYVRSGYADEEATAKLLHCILINLGAWDDDTGIKDNVLHYFFQPSAADACYENRTLDCIRANADSLPRCEVLKRAVRSFQCYYRNHGNIVQEPQFVPYSNVTRREEYKAAVLIEGLSRPVLEQFAAGNILDTPEFASIYYTFVLRTGFYDPQVGYNFQRVYVEWGNPELLEEPIRCCEANVRRQYRDEPQRVYQDFKQCLFNYVVVLPLIQDIARELLAASPAIPYENPAPCSGCGGPAPCSICNVTSYSCSSCGSPAPCSRCNLAVPAPVPPPASQSYPCSNCGSPTPCNRCNLPTPPPPPPSKPTPYSCSSCGGPAPCQTCSNSLQRFNGQPCYNGQCY